MKAASVADPRFAPSKLLSARLNAGKEKRTTATTTTTTKATTRATKTPKNTRTNDAKASAALLQRRRPQQRPHGQPQRVDDDDAGDDGDGYGDHYGNDGDDDDVRFARAGGFGGGDDDDLDDDDGDEEDVEEEDEEEEEEEDAVRRAVNDGEKKDAEDDADDDDLEDDFFERGSDSDGFDLDLDENDVPGHDRKRNGAMSDEHDDDDDDDDDGDNGDDGDDDGDGDDNGNDENEEDEDKDQEEDDVDLGEEEDKGDPSSSSSSRRPTGPLDSLLRKSRAADAGSDDPLATTQLSAAAPNAAAAAANGKKDNTGVIYISRIPPLLDLSKLRHLLAPHAGGPQHILRVYLVPEDPQKKRASRSGGRRHKSSSRRHRIRFVEGWIEIDSRRLARHLAEALHNTPMERKRGGSRFHDDLWSLRYLPRFRWAHLNEQFQIERKVRAARVRAEVAAVKRENEEYLRSVKKAKMLDGIAERKDKSKAASGGGRGGFELRVTREYRQRPAKNSAAGEGVGANAVPVRPMRAAILSKIFGQ